MELNVVEERSRRGCRSFERAAVHERDEIYERAVAVAIVLAEERVTYEVASVGIAVERAAPLVSPGYRHVADGNKMRPSWRERRNALDREFQSHLTPNGDFESPDEWFSNE